MELLDSSPLLPAHAGLEAYSVLTRLPPPHRVDATSVNTFLSHEFGPSWLTFPGDAVAALVAELATLGIVGGATYDGLIGFTARAAGAILFTCDRRARLVYDRLGVDVRFVG